MSELFLMTSILSRHKAKRFLHFYQEHNVHVTLNTLGRGTAASEILDYFGLEEVEKVLMLSIVTKDVWRNIKKGLQEKMNIDIPGTGIAFLIPLSSIGGKKQLQFLTEHQNFKKGEESTLKDTKHELLVVIANQGYTDIIMDAARKRKAGGGTVIHAKGTGMTGAQKFFGVSIAEEKEMVFLVVKREDKNNIMRAIMDEAGMDSKAKSIVFSLPVTSTAGMRLLEYAPDSEK
mgnify:FL=1